MARIFITGSSDGLGQMAGRLLVADGHEVFLHGRSPERQEDALEGVPGASGAVHGDLSSLAGIRQVADQANDLGRFDAVIHNAGVYLGPRHETGDGLERVFAVNVLAPYLLTATMDRPDRLVYMSSGLQESGSVRLDDLQWTNREWAPVQGYSDSKLLLVALTIAVSRKWPEVRANAVDPGWIATKMGGPHASPDIRAGAETQAWLAGSDDSKVTGATGGYWFHKRRERPSAEAEDSAVQDELVAECARLSGVSLPA